MVQTDLSQLTAECSEWRQILRNYKEEFTTAKESLLEIISKTLSKNDLAEVEHFDNQFHIQLINIHDLKQLIKLHERKMALESSGEITDEVFSRHEMLLDRFLSLENTFQELRNDFKNFISRISC
ncbi:MAG TPA: hypothetical protein VGO09_06485 [Flavisolibacter sp.]|jgi:hypothetical protein|nr:hypothetical protein [Flavisolibacter sp.]